MISVLLLSLLISAVSAQQVAGYAADPAALVSTPASSTPASIPAATTVASDLALDAQASDDSDAYVDVNANPTLTGMYAWSI